MATAGRILIIPKGDYDANATYEMLDLVNHNGFSWLAKRHTQGIAPSVEASDYWFMAMGITHKETLIADNLITTQEGYALDARQGMVLMDEIASVDTKVKNVEASVTIMQTYLAETNMSLNETQTSLASTQTSLAETQTSLEGTQTTLAGVQTSLADTLTAMTALNDCVETMQNNATITRGTLAVGATSITLSNSKLNTDSVISVYTSIWGANPLTVTLASGQVTLTFEAQASAVEVGVRIDG